MKKTLTLLVMFFGFVAAFAQTAPTFPYQAVVRNSQNQLMRDTTITIDVTVKQAGVIKYHEICQDVPTNHNGMLSFIIGAPADPAYAEYSLADVTDWSKVSFTFVYHLSDGDVTVIDSIRPVPYALQSDGGPSLTNLENRVNTFNTHVCDSVAACLDGANNALSQQIVRIVGDTLANGNSVLNHTVDTIATNNVRSYVDTSSHYTQTIVNNIDSSKAVRASVIQTVSDTLANGNSALNNAIDTIVENHITTLEGELCEKVADCVSSNPSLRDSIIGFITDTIAAGNNQLTAQIVKVINDTLANGNSVLNHTVDTIATNNVRSYVDTSSHYTQTIVNNIDSSKAVRASVIQTVSDTLANGNSALNNAIDTIVENHITTLEGELCEKVADCVSSNPSLRDSIIGFITDTIAAGNNQLTAQIVKVINDTLSNGNSVLNHTVDTIATNNVRSYVDTSSHYTQTIVNNIDSSKAVRASVIQTVSDTLANANSALNHIVDTIAAKAVSDSTVTVRVNGDTVGIFKLNQMSNALVDVTLNEASEKAVATASQVAFTLDNTPKSNFAVKMYINGVYVGSSKDGVVTITGTTATYVPSENGSYTLVAGDRVQFVYFY